MNKIILISIFLIVILIIIISVSLFLRKETDPVKTLTKTKTLKYENTGKLTWKTTRYRTYTRIYVPLGSKLISSEGAMVECNSKKTGQVETFTELDHTVFGVFTCTEMGATKELKLKYQLSPRIAAQLEQGDYNLLVQKQPGTLATNFNVKVDLGGKPTSSVSLDKSAKIRQNSFTDTTNLEINREYSFKVEN